MKQTPATAHAPVAALSFHGDGVGKGATFTIELPLEPAAGRLMTGSTRVD